jgi:hypothetical protein
MRRATVFDGFTQLFNPHRLHQIAMGAGRESVKDRVAVMVNREHDEGCIGEGRCKAPHAVDAGAILKLHIGQHDLGEKSRQLFEGGRLASAGRDTDTARDRIEHLFQCGSGCGIVLDDRHPHGARTGPG